MQWCFCFLSATRFVFQTLFWLGHFFSCQLMAICRDDLLFAVSCIPLGGNMGGFFPREFKVVSFFLSFPPFYSWPQQQTPIAEQPMSQEENKGSPFHANNTPAVEVRPGLAPIQTHTFYGSGGTGDPTPSVQNPHVSSSHHAHSVPGAAFGVDANAQPGFHPVSSSSTPPSHSSSDSVGAGQGSAPN